MTFARQSLGSLAALVFGVATSILLPRILGPEARGEYGLAVQLAGLVLAVAQWGIPEVLLQLMAERRGDPGALIGTALTLGIAGAAVIALILGLASPLFADNLLRGIHPVLLWLTLGGSLASLVALLARRFLQLGGRLDLYNGLDIGRTALFVVLVVGGGIVVPRQALGPTVAWAVSELALACVAILLLRRLFRPSADDGWRADRHLAALLVRSGAPIQIGLIGMYVGSRGGIFVLNANLDVAAVGIYSVALAAASLVLQISMALRTTLQPRLVAVMDDRDSAAVTARVTRHGVLWMVLIACGLALGSPLAGFVFGSEFTAVSPALVLMLPGMVAYGVWQLVAGYLLRVGRRGLLAIVAWVFGCLAIALQAAFTTTLGVVGAAVGLSLAYVVAMIVVVIAFRRISGRSVRELVPSADDIAFYVGLTRRVLAAR